MHWSNLPHWAQRNAVQFITCRLADSLPQEKLDEYRNLRQRLYYEGNKELWSVEVQQMVDRIVYWLCKGYGEMILRDAAVRDIVVKTIDFWNNKRYQLLAYVIMPNHLHMLLTPAVEEDMYLTLRDFKHYTTREINRYLNRRGSVWHSDSFDRMPRNNKEYNRYLGYNNPRCLPPSEYTMRFKGE